MKLSDYAKNQGVTYRTAWNWWKKGLLKGRQLPTGTIIVDVEPKMGATSEVACLYARISSSENRDNLERQAERLIQFATARGYIISRVVKEIGSGLNDNRKKLVSVLKDDNYTVLVVEHKDRLTRFGANYIITLFEKLGKRVEIINGVENPKDDLRADLAAVITSFCSQLYGLRRAKKKTEKIIAELE
ncbi:MAG: IS607 family transposase [Xenococcaceae cyanobacterium]